MLQHPLDHEHHIGAAGVVFVEDDGDGVAQRPGQDALVELGHLLAVAQLDRVLADQVDPADVAVEVDPHAGPVEMRRDLFDVGGLAGAVVALDHHPAVVGEAREDGERGVGIELVGRVDRRHPVGRLGEALHLHLGVDAEDLAHGDVFGRFRVQIEHWVRHRLAAPGTLPDVTGV